MVCVFEFRFINALGVSYIFWIAFLIEDNLFSESSGNLLQSAQFPCRYKVVVGAP